MADNILGQSIAIDQSVPGTTNKVSAEITSTALPTGAATEAKQLPDGHNVKVLNTYDGTNYVVARIDPYTFAIETIDYAHHEVHDGDYFRSGMNFTLSNGHVATFGFTTPNTTKWAHLTFDLDTTADGTFALLEDVTSFAGGAAVTPLNHNRNSLAASTVTCLRGMTGADLITPTGGTTILSATLATGKGAVETRSSGAEFIMKQNSKYLFRYTNGTSANVIQLKLEWYESTAKA
jgi:hypothetical protein